MLLDLRSLDTKANVHKKPCTCMFTVTLFLTAKYKKQVRWPSVSEWNQLWFIRTVEYYSGIEKRNGVTWVAQSVESPLQPRSWCCGLWVWAPQPGACFRFCVSFSLCPFPARAHSLALSFSKINIKKKERNELWSHENRKNHICTYILKGKMPNW